MTQPTRMRAWDVPKDAEVCLWKDAYKCISDLTAERDRLRCTLIEVEDILDAEVIRTDEGQTDEEIEESDPVWWAMILVARALNPQREGGEDESV